MHHAIVTLCIVLILGVSVGVRMEPAPQLPWAVTAAAFLAACALHRRRSRLAGPCILLCVGLVGVTRVQLALPAADPDHLIHWAGASPFACRAWVVGGPEKVETGLGQGLVRIRVRVGLPSPEPGGPFLAGEAVAMWPAASQPAVELGSLLTGRGRVVARHPEGGAGAETGAAGWRPGTLLAFHPVGRLHEAGVRPLSGLAAAGMRMRERVGRLVDRIYASESAPVVRAMFLGERSRLPAAVREDFRRSGTLHLLAQSGLHVGVLAFAVYGASRLLRLGSRIAAWVTLVFLGLFCLLVGPQVPVLRASLMGALILAGRLFGRSRDPYASVAFAAVVLLLWSPLGLFEAGFQLSFVATLSILYLWPTLSHLLRGLPGALNGLVSVSLAAFLGTAPLCIHHFHGIAIVSVISNLLLVPLASVILPCCLLSVLAGFVNPWIGFFFAAAAHGFVRLLLEGARLFAAPGWAYVDNVTLPVPWLFGYYVLMVLAGDATRLWAAAAEAWARLRSAFSRPLEAEILDLARVGTPELARIWRSRRGAIRAFLAASADRWRQRQHALGARLGEEGLEVSEYAQRLVAFGEAYVQLAPAAASRVPAVVAWLAALEWELQRRVFGPLRAHLRERVSAEAGLEPPVVRLLALGEGAVARLSLQRDLLWGVLTSAADERSPALAAVECWIRAHVTEPSFLLAEEELPLRLEEFVRGTLGRVEEEPTAERLDDLHAQLVGASPPGVLRRLAAAFRPPEGAEIHDSLQPLGEGCTESYGPALPAADGPSADPVDERAGAGWQAP